MTELTEGAMDLAGCERDPIHMIDAVQAPFGMLIVCPSRGIVLSASENMPALAGVDLDRMGGRALGTLFRDTAPLPLTDPDKHDGYTVSEPRAAVLANGTPVTVRAFPAGPWQGLLIDAGSVTPDLHTDDDLASLLDFNRAAEAAITAVDPDVAAMCDALAATVGAIAGYDRVLVYRFDADLNGTVIAERRLRAAGESFLGLSFPSSDMPPTARALMLRNRARPVIDALAPAIPLVHLRPETAETGVDIGACPERAVSPVHIAYLGAMGVRATLTVALVVRGRLWGLLSCHNARPRHLSAQTVSLCRAACDLLSSTFARLEDTRDAEYRDQLQQIAMRMRARALDRAKAPRLQTVIDAEADALLALFDADGLSFISTTADVTIGQCGPTPVRHALTDAATRWCEKFRREVFGTNRIADFWPDLATHLLPHGAGLLAAAPVNASNAMLVFRRARTVPISWAGDPAARAATTDRLGPRRSFEGWRETQVDRGLPWTETERRLSGALRALLTELSWIIDRRQTERHMIAAHRLVQDAHRALEHSTLHDALTGLLNRRAALAALETGLAEGPSDAIALLHIDLDRFKAINDTLGHEVGDAVLVHAAAAIRAQTLPEDVMARIGGDEFLLIAHAGRAECALADLAQRLITALSEPVRIGNEVLHFGASVGISRAAGPAVDARALLARADIALYESKRLGGGRFCFVTDEMEQRRIESRRLGDEILQGLRDGAFEVLYQPQFHAETLDIAGAEALVRWRHPTRGLLTPESFLDAAESVGALNRIDAFVVERAMADLAAWRARGLAVPRVSVNLSARRLSDPDLLNFLDTPAITPTDLAFELLESVDLERLDETARANLDRIRAAGIALEIDDFGSGHSSIVTLVQIRPDRLKIERSLVGPALDSAAARKLLDGVLDIARTLGIAATLEGVETDAHVQRLRGAGASLMQGFALGRPVAAEALTALSPARKAELLARPGQDRSP